MNGYFEDIPEPNLWWTLYWVVAGLVLLVLTIGLGSEARAKDYDFWRLVYGLSQATLLSMVWPITVPLAIGYFVEGAVETPGIVEAPK